MLIRREEEYKYRDPRGGQLVDVMEAETTVMYL